MQGVSSRKRKVLVGKTPEAPVTGSGYPCAAARYHPRGDEPFPGGLPVYNPNHQLFFLYNHNQYLYIIFIIM